MNCKEKDLSKKLEHILCFYPSEISLIKGLEEYAKLDIKALLNFPKGFDILF